MVEPISTIKIIRLDEVEDQEEGLIKSRKGKEPLGKVAIEGKGQSYFGGCTEELDPTCFKMLTTEVQPAVQIYHKY